MEARGVMRRRDSHILSKTGLQTAMKSASCDGSALPPGRLSLLISVKDKSTPGLLWARRIRQLKDLISSQRIEAANFLLVAECLDQLLSLFLWTIITTVGLLRLVYEFKSLFVDSLGLENDFWIVKDLDGSGRNGIEISQHFPLETKENDGDKIRTENFPNSVALSPQANHTDWSTATCRRNLVSTFVDRGVWRGQRGGSPTVVNLCFLDRSRYFYFK
jgi:hypothetical protein